jgi:hypothetical protein
LFLLYIQHNISTKCMWSLYKCKSIFDFLFFFFFLLNFFFFSFFLFFTKMNIYWFWYFVLLIGFIEDKNTRYLKKNIKKQSKTLSVYRWRLFLWILSRHGIINTKSYFFRGIISLRACALDFCMKLKLLVVYWLILWCINLSK